MGSQSIPIKERAIHFSGLNSLRFFSAFSIILYHSTLNFHDGFPAAIKMFFHNLHLGVDMFFIISGFLIVYLLLEEKDTSGTVSLYKFYVRRILRIFPLYFLIVGIAWLQYHASHPEIVWEKYLYFAANFWMIQTNAWTVGILNPLWSLNIEEHFYLVIPILILFIPKRKIHLLFVGIIIFSIAFRIYSTVTIQYNWFTIYLHTLSRCDGLAMGGLLAYYHKFRNFKSGISTFFLGLAVIYLFLVMCIVDSSDFTSLTFAVFKKYLFILPMFFIFIGFILNSNSDSTALHWLKSNRIIDYLGKISFGLYMYHSPIGDYIGQYDFIQNSLLFKPLITTILTIVIASVSYELFEKQILKLKSKFEVVTTSLHHYITK